MSREGARDRGDFSFPPLLSNALRVRLVLFSCLQITVRKVENLILIQMGSNRWREEVSAISKMRSPRGFPFARLGHLML